MYQLQFTKQATTRVIVGVGEGVLLFVTRVVTLSRLSKRYFLYIRIITQFKQINLSNGNIGRMVLVVEVLVWL